MSAMRFEASQPRSSGWLLHGSSVTLLVGAAVVYVVYLWKVIPVLAATAHLFNQALPLMVRAQIVASNVTARLSPLIVGMLGLIYVLVRQGRIKLPDSVRSGTALSIATGTVLLFTLVGFLSALLQVAEFVPRR
jgi:hypothetical protein